MMEGLLYDLRFAVRRLRHDRGFTIAAVAMLALAIGLNVTVFAVMDTMLFRGFPHVQQNDRLLYLQERLPSGICCISYRDFEDWRAQAPSFSALAFVGGRAISLRDGGGRPLDTTTWSVSANTFGLLGVPPLLGRDFTPADEVAGAAPVAILNYRFWDSRFGRRADIVGLTVHINGALATIIGVMPERFDFPIPHDLWMPLARGPELEQRGLTPGGFLAVGRLRDGASPADARAELETINRRLEADYPATNRQLAVRVVTHSQLNSGPDAAMIWGSLWAAAWFVLLIACANLANLSLVRTIGRWRDFSTRMALGAGQGRLIRQVMAESALVATIAGVLGWWLTIWSVRRWALATASPYQVLDFTVDGRTLAYLIAIAAAAAILCALAPIVRVAQLGATGALQSDARSGTPGRRGKRLAAGLVASQMALAVVLLSGAGVLVRSLMTIVGADTGVRDPEHVLVGSLSLPSDKYSSAADQLRYFDRLDAQLRTVAGVEATTVARTIPVRGVNSRPFEIEGRPTTPDARTSVQFLTAGSDYFRLLGASATAGRDFNDSDQPASAPVAIVNQSFAAAFWPGEQALGKRLRTFDRNTPGPWRTVVGVVPNIMQGDALRQHFKPLVYLPFRQQPSPRAFLFVRTGVQPQQVARAVRAEMQAIDREVIVESLATLKARFAFERDFMDPEHSELQKHAVVAPIFALMALLLAAIGLFAVLAHAVSQRTKEIGVRIAIGAAAADIRRLILRDGLWPVAVGLIAGLTAALAGNRVLQSQLVGVSPYDPATMAGAPMVLIVVALLACHIPARRAMHVDPVVALRHD